MTPEDWHRQYGELVRDRDTQARHVAALDDELYEEKQKLIRLEIAVRNSKSSAPSAARGSTSAPSHEGDALATVGAGPQHDGGQSK